jgi:hypothetical protein
VPIIVERRLDEEARRRSQPENGSRGYTHGWRSPDAVPSAILSLKQPWACAVAASKKRIENGTWSTPFRGTVHIHASSNSIATALDRLRDQARVTPLPEFVHGAVVAGLTSAQRLRMELDRAI